MTIPVMPIKTDYRDGGNILTFTLSASSMHDVAAKDAYWQLYDIEKASGGVTLFVFDIADGEPEFLPELLTMLNNHGFRIIVTPKSLASHATREALTLAQHRTTAVVAGQLGYEA